MTMRTLREFEARGIVDPESKLELAPEGDLLSKTEEALFLARSKGGWLDDQTKPERNKLMAKVSETIADFEGRVPYAYDDHTGKKWTRNSKGDPTVGVGFNLNRPDADKLMKEIGVKKSDVLAGKVELTEAQQDQLLDLSMRETSNWLRDHFKGVDMENHRWMALLSIAFNSRWNERGPTLIGPRLTAAVKEGRWDDAAIEIEEHSAGGVPKRLLAGIKARRRKEANLFRGAVL
jgi:GH24 family phage-related lysozyme (muramidase)